MNVHRHLLGWVVAWLFLGPLDLKALDCLTQLDSISYYLRTFPQKALVTSDSLLISMKQQDCGTDSTKADVYNNLGLIFWELGDYERADSAFRYSLNTYLKLYDSTSYQIMPLYLNYSGMYQAAGDPIKAEKFLLLLNRTVLANFGYETKEFVEVLYRMGLFYLNSGKYQEGLKHLKEALQVAGEAYVEKDSIQSRLLIEIGTAERIIGNYAQSRNDLNNALININDNEGMMHLMAVDRLASLRTELGEFASSETDLLRNLEVKYKLFTRDTLSIIETLNNLGLLYFRLNDLGPSKKYFTDAMRLASNYRVICGTLLNNLGTIFWREGQLEEAEEHFIGSSGIFREVYGAIHPDYASSLNNLATIYNAEGDYENALSTYLKVLDLDEVLTGNQHPRYATTLNNIALVFINLGQPEFAESMLTQALSIRKETLGINHPLYVKTLNDLGIYYLIVEDQEEALNQFDQALELEIKHMQDVFPVLTNTQREQFFEEIKYNIERFSSLAFNNGKKWQEKAFNYFINTKSVLFYAADKMRQVVQSSNNQALIDLYQSWRAIKFRLAQVFLLSAEEKERQGLSIETLERGADDLEKELGQAFKVFADQTENHFYDWRTIQEAMSDSVALVEILHYRKYQVKSDSSGFDQGFIGSSNYVSFVLHANTTLEIIQWEKNMNLERMFSFYRNSLQFSFQDTVSYDTYWKEINKHLDNTQRVYFAADGIFHKINPALLYDTDNKNYVADKYHIVNITSGKDLIVFKKDESKLDAKIFGNPAYQTLNLNTSIDPLPNAEREAEEISKILTGKGWQVETNYNLAATEEKLKATRNPGILHVATHGYFSEEDEEHNALFNSGLYMARSNEQSQDDGILTAYEAMNLTLDDTDLVVLSACETALGQIKNGEGVFGLQRAFLVAGANHLILSLVKVEDEATKTFMELFYTRLTESRNIEEAFFRSRELFREKYPNPYNWGAFILLSN